MYDYTKINKTKTKNDVRTRTINFFQENEYTYADYPENTRYLIDREDIASFHWYYSEHLVTLLYKANYMSAASGVSVIAYRVFKQARISRAMYLIPFVPLFGSCVISYISTVQFLDYAATKYEFNGLWDKTFMKDYRGTISYERENKP